MEDTSLSVAGWLKIRAFTMIFLGFWMITPPIIPLFIAYLLYVRFILFAPIFALYLVWFGFTYRWPERGSMPSLWFRTHAPYMAWAGDYFNYRIVKTEELPTDRNYIVGSHPHGLLCLGMFMSFSSYMAGITSLYNGIRFWSVTLAGQFFSPIRREIIMLAGIGAVTKRNIQWVVRRPEKGQAVSITIGGLNEAIVAAPGQYYLKLKDRKGFAKLALTEGADLVPMFHFGENEMYEAVEGICPIRLRNMQARLLRTFGFCPPLLIGRSMLGLPWGGLVPIQTRMESVIGGAIRVEKSAKPTDEEVDKLHAKYCEKLVDLFEAHKANYGIRPEQKIVLY
ncbi:hypothetical protein PMAYCL1PPCAC_13254 [Pristionchus mayeri]|uniref:Acyltransferase n=1 Tax=Pristionchus mayeri TaxID=1317129 RepID=A0AAN4ZND1_9BILA|nr:hypothetical protein PMAYCL1PPCAC_13254 [Pristionchus mayeri]